MHDLNDQTATLRTEPQPSDGAGPTRPNSARAKRIPPMEIRNSGVHGLGAFATRKIRKSARIIEYTGTRMPWRQAPDSDGPHTFLFGLDDGVTVINAGIGGNEARWINHSCEPNCEAVEEGDQIFIYALRTIQPGEELFYDYALQVDEPRTPESEREHECRCGAAKCRGTLLGDK